MSNAAYWPLYFIAIAIVCVCVAGFLTHFDHGEDI